MTLACHGLSVRFGAVAAVDGVDLQIGDHQLVGLIGPHGSATTTPFHASRRGAAPGRSR